MDPAAASASSDTTREPEISSGERVEPGARPERAETVESEVPGKAAGRAIRVRFDGLTVWIDPWLVTEVHEGRRSWVARGRASRNLSSVAAFVPDDAFGAAALIGHRRFELALDAGHELNTMLSGMPIFLQLESAGATSLSAALALWLEPRLTTSSTVSELALEPRVEAIFFRDPVDSVRYRGTLHTGEDCTVSASASVQRRGTVLGEAADAPGVPIFVLESGTTRPFDWTFDALAAAARGGRDSLAFGARCNGGDEVVQRATLRVAVARVGLTRGMADAAWPSPGCSQEAAACVRDREAAQDLSRCGTFREVLACETGD